VAAEQRDDRGQREEIEERRPELHRGQEHQRYNHQDGNLREHRRGGFGHREDHEADGAGGAGELEQLQAPRAEQVEERAHCHFAEPFVTQPEIARRRI